MLKYVMFMKVDVISLKATCLPNGKIPIGNLFLYLISITNLFEIEILSDCDRIFECKNQ